MPREAGGEIGRSTLVTVPLRSNSTRTMLVANVKRSVLRSVPPDAVAVWRAVLVHSGLL